MAEGGAGLAASLDRALAVAGKEVRHILRDWRTLLVILGMPMFMMFLFGYALNSDVSDIPVAVVDPSPTPESRDLAERIDASQLFQVRLRLAVAPDPAELFRADGVKAVFRLAPDFARNLRRPGAKAEVQVLVDGSDPNLGTIIRNSAESFLTQACMDIAGATRPRPLVLEPRVLYNPEQRSAFFFVPGLMALILMMISALLTSITLTREKETGTLDQLFISPLRPGEIILGKLLPYLALAAMDGALILGVGRAVFGLRIAGDPALLAGGSLLYLLTALAIGLLISAVAKRQQHAMLAALGATMMPTVLLSGYVFPVASMPWPLRAISSLLPATYFLQIVRGIILKGVGFQDLWRPFAVLAAEGLAIMALSIARFKVRP